MIDFIVDNDIKSAFESVKKAKRYAKNNLEWRYSESFLYFWIGDFKKALSLCQKIKNKVIYWKI